MGEFDLLKEVVTLTKEAIKKRKLVNALPFYSYDAYPNLETVLNIEEANKELEIEGLKFFQYTSDKSKLFLTTLNMAKYYEVTLNGSDELSIYRKLDTYEKVLKDVMKEDYSLDYADEVFKNVKYHASNLYKVDVNELLANGTKLLTEVIKGLESDYELLTNAAPIYLKYKEIIESVLPTGNYAELVEFLKAHNLELTRLEKVNGIVKEFEPISFKLGKLGYDRNFKVINYSVNRENYDNSLYLSGSIDFSLGEVERKMKDLELMKEELLLSKEIIRKMDRLLNVNYYVKEERCF